MSKQLKVVSGVFLSCLVLGVGSAADNQTKKALSLDQLKAIWQNGAVEKQDALSPQNTADASTSAVAAGPNALVHGAPPAPPGENNNSSVSWSEATPGEVYAVYNEFGGPGLVPSLIGSAFSPAGGAPGTWVNLGPIPPSAFPSEWNATIASHPFGPFHSASAGWVGPPFMSGNGIMLNITGGAGAPFGAPVGPLLPNVPFPAAGATWHDFPYTIIDDVPANPAPGFGTQHVAWVQYHEGGDGDADGDGNPFNDPADGYDILFSWTNTIGGPFVFPAFAPPFPISPILPIAPGQHQEPRPSLAVVGAPGTPAVPPGGVYVAWNDIVGGGIWVDASPAPGAGAPFGVLPPGPVIPTGPPVPPVVPAGPPIAISSGVSILVDQGAGAGGCPGNVYVTWADMSLGDADIWFTYSTDGGATWKTPIRVNCDPPGSGAMQWAPKIAQDPATGNLCIVYYDQRSSLAGYEVWGSVSTDCGITWTDGLVSDAGPIPAVSTIVGVPAPGGALWVGDYLGNDISLVATTTFGHTFSDGRNGADQDVMFEVKKDIDADCDGFPVSVDCDDTDPSIFPGATEVCDGKDNDCDSQIDEGFDIDGDGWTTCAGDCNDNNASIFPGATEILCNGVDENCNGLADDDIDADADGVTFCGGDCDDNDPNRFPGNVEVCDGVDNDCDGTIDNGFDLDGDGWTTCAGDCDDGNPAVFPGATEILCNGVDENCNGLADDDTDADADGVTFCNGDCDDNDPNRFPGNVEVCDGVDNDCDGIIDNGFDLDGDGWTTCAGDCDDTDPLINPAASEICGNGKDDDCDGLIDSADPNCSNVVHPGAIGVDQNNASVALSEIIGGHVYVSFNEFLGPGPGPVPSTVSHAWSSGGGAPGTWTYLGPVPPGAFPESWNATITGHHLGGYFLAEVGYAMPPYAGPSGIQLSGNAGGGATFIPPGPPIHAGVAGATWVDFPYLSMQEDPAAPLPDLGTGHIAWVEYIDGDGDPNGDLNLFNDPGDRYQIWYSFSNTIAGPFFWPVASPPTLIQPPLPVAPLQHQTHRPAVDVVNTASAVHHPVGAVYVAWTDGVSIWIDVNPTPIAATPWLGIGPVLPIGPLVPPVIVPGVAMNASSSVTLTVDDGPMCPGNVYLAWADMTSGDADIWFSSSADGGSTWSPPILVNCDPPGAGADQWAPQMRVDPVNGDICIVYYDTRNAPGAGVETWASVSKDCGLTWSDHMVSLAGPNPPFNVLPNPPGPAGGSFAGDYLGVDINATNGFGMAWNDGRNGSDEDVFYQPAKQPASCSSTCCVTPGDFNHDGAYNIADVTAGIAYIFSGGAAPSCCEEADFNGDGSYNIADVTAGIAFIFSGGAPPTCGPAGMSCMSP